jgi:hypothetical protein
MLAAAMAHGRPAAGAGDVFWLMAHEADGQEPAAAAEAPGQCPPPPQQQPAAQPPTPPAERGASAVVEGWVMPAPGVRGPRSLADPAAAEAPQPALALNPDGSVAVLRPPPPTAGERAAAAVEPASDMADASDVRLQRALAARDAEFAARVAAAAAGGGAPAAGAGIWGPCCGGGAGSTAAAAHGSSAAALPPPPAADPPGGAAGGSGGGDTGFAERLRLADERFRRGAWGAGNSGGTE